MAKSINFRTAYGKHDSKDYAYVDGLPSLTQQNFKNECDINFIMKRWEKTGELTHVRSNAPSYGDFSNLGDYQSSLNVVLAAQEAFDSLPAVVRNRFSNDPAMFVEFVQDPSNADAIVELGLAAPRPVLDESRTEMGSSNIGEEISQKTASKSVSDP